MSQQRGAARMWWTYSREETVQALAELEAIGERLGGGFVVTPVRQRVVVDGEPQEDPSGKPLYQTVAWCFKHESFMPAVDPSRTASVGGKRKFVFDRDGNRCVNCGATDDLTIDHIVPTSRGGTDQDDNLQTLCRACNESKGSSMPVQEAELELHFPDQPMQPPVDGVIEGEPIPGDPTEGLTEEEIAANRAARTGDGDPDAADAVVGAGDGRTQS